MTRESEFSLPDRGNTIDALTFNAENHHASTAITVRDLERVYVFRDRLIVFGTPLGSENAVPNRFSLTHATQIVSHKGSREFSLRVLMSDGSQAIFTFAQEEAYLAFANGIDAITMAEANVSCIVFLKREDGGWDVSGRGHAVEGVAQ